MYRLATDQDGPAIGKLFQIAGYADYGVDWSRPDAGVGGWWIVAESDGEIRGAVMIAAGKPYGYIGEIVVHPDERGRDAGGNGRLGARLGHTARMLYAAACHALREAGSQIVFGVVHPELEALEIVLVKAGAQKLGTYHLFARRLS